MINLKLEILVILYWMNYFLMAQECPKPEIIHPCICNNTTKTFKCEDIQFTELANIFTTASKTITNKVLLQFTLENSSIDKIGFRVFSDMRFKKVHFINCTNLTFIDQDSFGGQTPFMEEIIFDNTPVLNSPPKELDLFDALSRLPSLKLIDLSGTQLSEVPEDAFMTILPWLDHQVKQLYFCHESQKCRSIRKVGKKPFYYLFSIELIDLSRHRINYIDEYAFSIHNMTITNSNLKIILDDNELNDQSFDDNAFEYIGKPTILSLVNNKNLTYLKQQVFEPFLIDNKLNQLNVTLCPIDWNSDQMKWFKDSGLKYQNRVHF